MSRIYLDYAATTPVDDRVVQKMLPYFSELFGNPSSTHSFGREAQTSLRKARQAVADALHCSPKELHFTSGGTESDNLAVLGTVRKYKKGSHVITTQIEHQAVLSACAQLEKEGYEVTYLPVDACGMVDLKDVQAAIRPQTVLISVMFGNNEIGTVQPIVDIGTLAKEKEITFHVDAVQALGTERIDLHELPVDLMSFSAHKIYGPKGSGILYVSASSSVQPLQFGGKQERKVRGGTENLPGIVGLAEAVRWASKESAAHKQHLLTLKQTMIEQLSITLTNRFKVNGSLDQSLPHILNLSFPGIKAETLIMNLDLEGIAVSSGSACSSGSIQPSHVLQAMGLPLDIVQSAIRISFGKQTTVDEIKEAAAILTVIVKRIRKE